MQPVGFTCSEYETVSLHCIAAGHVFAHGVVKKVHDVIVYTYYIHMYIYIYVYIDIYKYMYTYIHQTYIRTYIINTYTNIILLV